jgi:SLT domain-containing protein
MATESGGNPTIVNKWDSNWLAGHPSVGLMQVIAGTFGAYAGPYRNVGPFEYGVSVNPMANIYAGINYAIHRYGNPGWLSVLGHGHGYDQGGWLPPGFSVAYNGTGVPERVSPPGRGGDPHGPPLIGNVTFAYNDSGNVHQAMNDLLFTMKHARQSGFGGSAI